MKQVVCGLVFVIFLASQTSLPAQSRRPETKTFQGEIAAVDNGKITWETDGKSGPLPYDRMTRWNVSGKGDAGFVGKGASVTIEGILKPDGRIIDALLKVHRNPRETMTAKNATVKTADPMINLNARVLSLEPLTVQAIDSITMIKGSSDNGEKSRPVFNAKLSVVPRDPELKSVGLVLGNAPQFVGPGDYAEVVVASNRPTVASAITIRKSDIIKFEDLETRAKPKKRSREKSDAEKTKDEPEAAASDE